MRCRMESQALGVVEVGVVGVAVGVVVVVAAVAAALQPSPAG